MRDSLIIGSGLLAGVLAGSLFASVLLAPRMGPAAAPGGPMTGRPGVAVPTGPGPAVAVPPQISQPAPPAKPARQPAPEGLKPLPAPKIQAPLGVRPPQLVKYEVETREVPALMDEGIAYTFWTYDGTVPGPLLRVRQGDTIELTLKNSPTSKLTHSIDLHSVTGPGGGAKVTQVAPGESATFKWKAMNPGVYVYHCATPLVPHHIASGMYGLIVVEPPEGLPQVDREFYVMQGDFYLDGQRDEAGLHEFAMKEMTDEHPSHIVFNGSVGALAGDNILKAKVGETVRIFFGVGGPNITSSFHVIGEIFDRVWAEGASEIQRNIQTTMVPAGGATIVDFKIEVPGTYVLVDHSLGRLTKGAAGMILAEGGDNPDVFQVLKAPGK
ncbi:MAG: copper-containing nitrite reductase [Chloroflexota bacterium]